MNCFTSVSLNFKYDSWNVSFQWHRVVACRLSERMGIDGLLFHANVVCNVDGELFYVIAKGAY